MQFKPSFAVLLTSFFFASTQLGVDAAPLLVKRNPDPAPLTIPLHHFQHRQDDHPLIAFQKRHNRALKRLAFMTGRTPPSKRDLAERLQKRILLVGGEERLAKRFNRVGVPSRKKSGGSRSGSLALESLAADTNGVPNGVTVSSTPTTNNSLALDIEGSDVSYLATVQMGTPPRDFLILMDSGSADLWVGSETCVSQTGGGCGNHKFLGSNSSASFQDTQNPFSVTYGSGAVGGTIVADNLKIGNFSLPGHTFGVANNESIQFSDSSVPFDGLMGLAQSKLSQQRKLTPVEALAKAGLIQEAITSFKIPRLADGKQDGQITFGALDTTKFDQKTLVTVDNVSKVGFWEAPVDGITVNGKDVGLQNRTAILDTGTTLMIVPPADATAVHSSIPGAQSDGQGGFQLPCKGNTTVAVAFGGRSFAIQYRDIAVELDPRSNTCQSGIAAGDINGPEQWLVGDVFLKNAYFSTNVKRNQMSLAILV